MRSLPLFLEEDGFRAVHACWNDTSIARLKALTGRGVLSEEQLVAAADRNKVDEMFLLAEQITKGPEHPLPEGWSYEDKNGTERDHVRLKWWYGAARTWQEISISVPSEVQLPETALPDTLTTETYPANAQPVFFGHYWLNGEPVIQSPNALCLDYSAGKDGPLVSYALSDPAEPLSTDNIRVHAAAS